MVLFNYSTKELTAKIVYYGPGLCGKTTNLEFIYESLPEEKRGRMLSLSTQTDRTLYFDFLPVELGDIRGMKTRVQLYTVPGQVFYNETRRLVLKGVDGIVFVADSQSRVSDANIESFHNLEENLKVHGLSLSEIPMVLQFNKRDLPDIRSVEDMNAELNRYNAPFYEVIATTGIGVHDTLKAISKLVLRSLNQRYDSSEQQASTPPLAAPTGKGDVASEMPPIQETPAVSSMSDGAAQASGDQPSARGGEWETAELESELDQMDATEIQGLLEEVDCFEAEGAESLREADPVHETSFAPGEDDNPASPDTRAGETDLFRTPSSEGASAGAPLPKTHKPADDSFATAAEAPGSDISEEKPASAPVTRADPREVKRSPPAPPPEEEGDHAVWMGAPEQPEDTRLPGDRSVAGSGAGETELSFENYLEQKQGNSHGEGAGDDDALTSSPRSLLQDEKARPQQDTVTALQETDDRRPTLLPGEPVQDVNGHLRVPIQLEMGGRQYTYILTLTLQPQVDDPA